MEALFLQKPGQIDYQTKATRPIVGDGYCLVKVLKAGICSTDLGLIAGLYNYQGILGHEFVGVVEEGPSQLVGKRVVGNINIACLRCSNCENRAYKHCHERKVLGIRGHNGAFANYLTLPEQNLVIVPDNLSNQEATFAEPLAAALDVLSRVSINQDDQVLIIGDGRMGQLIARVLLTQTNHLHLLGKHSHKLALLPPEVSATTNEQSLPEKHFDAVIECTGNTNGFQIALKKIRAEGSIILKSTYPDTLSIDSSLLVVNELKIIGSRCGNMQHAIEFMQNHPLNLDRLIDNELPLSAYEEALKKAKESVKVIFSME